MITSLPSRIENQNFINYHNTYKNDILKRKNEATCLTTRNLVSYYVVTIAKIYSKIYARFFFPTTTIPKPANNNARIGIKFVASPVFGASGTTAVSS